MFCMRAVGRTRVFWRLQCSFLAVISVIKSNDRALSKTKMTAFWKKLSWNSSIAAVKYSHYRVRSDDPQSMAMGEKRSEGKLCASLYSYSIHEVLSLRRSHEQSPAASARKKRFNSKRMPRTYGLFSLHRGVPRLWIRPRIRGPRGIALSLDIIDHE